MTATYTTSTGSRSELGGVAAGLPLPVFKQVTNFAGLVHPQVSFTNRTVVFAVGILDTRTAHAPSPLPVEAWQRQPIYDIDRGAVVVVIRDRIGSTLPRVDLETVSLTLTGVTRHKNLTNTEEFAGTDDPAFSDALEPFGIAVFGPLPLRSPISHL